jgi:hypothetical protein
MMDAARNMLYDWAMKPSRHPTAVLADALDRQGAMEAETEINAGKLISDWSQ